MAPRLAVDAAAVRHAVAGHDFIRPARQRDLGGRHARLRPVRGRRGASRMRRVRARRAGNLRWRSFKVGDAPGPRTLAPLDGVVHGHRPSLDGQ